MRHHKTADGDDEAMLKRLAEMAPEQQEHFKAVVRLLATCYEPNATASGVFIIRNDKNVSLLSINANDMATTEMVMRASEVLQDTVCEDAPPRELFN